MKIRTIIQVTRELRALYDWRVLCADKRVQALLDTIRQENVGRIAELQAELKALEQNKPKPKPRWPETTPVSVLTECQAFWRGTEESRTYRIHCWNDKVICTSYPSGSYSDNGGRHPAQARFYYISRTELDYHRAKQVGELAGRQSAKQLQAKLDDLTKEMQ